MILLFCVLQIAGPENKTMAEQTRFASGGPASSISREGAISLSNALVKNLIEDDATAVYAKMERTFRQGVTEKEMPAMPMMITIRYPTPLKLLWA